MDMKVAAKEGGASDRKSIFSDQRKAPSKNELKKHLREVLSKSQRAQEKVKAMNHDTSIRMAVDEVSRVQKIEVFSGCEQTQAIREEEASQQGTAVRRCTSSHGSSHCHGDQQILRNSHLLRFFPTENKSKWVSMNSQILMQVPPSNSPQFADPFWRRFRFTTLCPTALRTS